MFVGHHLPRALGLLSVGAGGRAGQEVCSPPQAVRHPHTHTPPLTRGQAGLAFAPLGVSLRGFRCPGNQQTSPGHTGRPSLGRS